MYVNAQGNSSNPYPIQQLGSEEKTKEGRQAAESPALRYYFSAYVQTPQERRKYL
jgi:hypothetical protein